MSNQETPAPRPSFDQPEFDQIVKGNVTIKKISKHKYRITFRKIGKFLIYQVWDKDNQNLNNKRQVSYVSAKTWVNRFIKQNKNLKEMGKELFTPTTIMETVDGDHYAFVIRKAYFDSNHRVVFTISTKEIQLANNFSKKLINIQTGCYNNMRFDIDADDDFEGCYIDENENTICLEGQELIDEMTERFGIDQQPTGVVDSEQSGDFCRPCWQIRQYIGNPSYRNKNFYFIKPGVKLKFCDNIYDKKTSENIKGAYTCSSYGGKTALNDGDTTDQDQCFRYGYDFTIDQWKSDRC